MYIHLLNNNSKLSAMATSGEKLIEDELQSESLENVRTPSPSILDSPSQVQKDSPVILGSEDDDDDNVNVTIRPVQPFISDDQNMSVTGVIQMKMIRGRRNVMVCVVQRAGAFKSC